MIDPFLIMSIALAASVDTPPNSGGTQILIAALGAGSIGAVLAAVITGVFT